MQTPAPCGYERATTVDGAIASLVEFGPTARIIAGGHSLIPMMKLRLATPEHLIDINDLDELAYIRRDGDELRIGAMTRHVGAAEVRAAGRALPGVRRRRGGDRRPGRPQPRHDRRIAVPGRSRRGPVGGLLGGQGQRRDPLGRGRARARHARVSRRPVPDRGRCRRAVDRDPDPDPAGRGLRAREGRAPRRRLRDLRGCRRRSGSTAAASPTSASRWGRPARSRSTWSARPS